MSDPRRPKLWDNDTLCNICKDKLGNTSGHPYREYKYEGITKTWTGNWLCHNCRSIYDPNSDRNIHKSLTNRRTHNQNPNHNNTKGDLFEELTCKWRCVKRLGVVTDNYLSPIDHTRDAELGIIQTKGRTYNSRERFWSQNWTNERDKDFDFLIFYCMNKDMKIVERIYIFPLKEVIKRTGISIYKNPSRGIQWYEKYRIKDENVLRKVNEIWIGMGT